MSLVFKDISKVSNDLQMLVRDWRNDDNIRKYMYNEEIISIENHQNWLLSLTETDKKEVYMVFYDEMPIGLISVDNIDRVNKRCEWAFYIYDTSLRGKGIGKKLEISMLDYIFNDLKMEKLNCSVLETNPNVVEMHKKFGFQVEGIRRKDILKEDGRLDVYELGMLDIEWKEIRENIDEVDLATFEK